jgi:hypothetical protein
MTLLLSFVHRASRSPRRFQGVTATAPRRDGDGCNDLVLLHVFNGVIQGVPRCRSLLLSLYLLIFDLIHAAPHASTAVFLLDGAWRGLAPRRCVILPPRQRR